MKRSNSEKSERILEDNRRLKRENEELKKQIRILKSKNRTLDTAWRKSEQFLTEVTDGRSVEEIVRTVAKGKKLAKFESACSRCGSAKVQILKFKNFRVVVCEERSCKHREKIDGSKAEQE